MLIEFEHSRPVIVDRSLYRELAKTAITRAHTDLTAKTKAAATVKKAARTANEPDDAATVARRDRDGRLRELAERGHAANSDLGISLIHNLSTVDPADITVARFFVYALLGPDPTTGGYSQTGDRVRQLAASGIRLIVDELRTDATKTRKDGTPGRLRIDYGDPHNPETAVAWLWKFIDQATTAGELYGRALVVIAAEHYATRLVVPASQRTHPTRWASPRDLAAKALTKLAAPRVPATLAQLERAVKRAHATHDQAVRAAHSTATEGAPPDAGETPGE